MKWFKKLAAPPPPATHCQFDSSAVDRVIVWRPGGLGDSLLAVPMLRGLRATHGAPIDFYGHPGALPLLMACGLVNRTGDITNSNDRPPVLEYAATDDHTAAVLHAQFDNPGLAIVFSRDTDLAAEACRRIGLRNWVAAPATPTGMHQARWMCNQAGVVYDDSPLSLKTQHHTAWYPPSIWLAPGSAYACKQWPFERFQKVGVEMVLRGHHAGYLKDGFTSWPDPILSSFGGNVLEIAELMRHRPLFIGNDSGMTHLAALMGCPTIALYGPTHPETWGPIGPNVTVLRGCRKKAHEIVHDFFVCTSPHCMKLISVDEVLKATEHALP